MRGEGDINSGQMTYFISNDCKIEDIGKLSSFGFDFQDECLVDPLV